MQNSKLQFKIKKIKTIFHSSLFTFRSPRMEVGYTLIELLVSMGVIVTVGAVLTTIIFSSLQGANKSNSISLVRENGNFAISQIAKTIRNAQSVGYPCDTTPPTPTPPAIVITAQDGTQTTFSCDTTLRSNGASMINTSVVSLVPASCAFTCSRPSPIDIPTINIAFSLTRNGGSVLEQQVTPILFQTTITLRSPAR